MKVEFTCSSVYVCVHKTGMKSKETEFERKQGVMGRVRRRKWKERNDLIIF